MAVASRDLHLCWLRWRVHDHFNLRVRKKLIEVLALKGVLDPGFYCTWKLACISRTPYMPASSGRIQLSLQLPQKYQYFSTNATANTSKDCNEEEQTINVTFVETDGTENHIKVPVGTNMLEAAHSNDIELEGACEGSCACSTCHVIVMDMDYYNRLEDPADEENDMLDLAFGLTDTSRLGCQIQAKPEIDGIRLALPVATRNFAVDGHKPKPH